MKVLFAEMNSEDHLGPYEKYFEYFSKNSSCHGGNCIVKISNFKIKSILLLCLFFLQIFLCLVIGYKIFLEERETKTRMDWKKGESFQLPFMTVCNPRHFDRKTVEGNLHLTNTVQPRL